MQAVQLYQSDHGTIDGILMDVQMPQIDGFEATRIIRRWELINGVRPVPIIAVTANSTEEDRLDCLQAGMNDYLSKPHTILQLRGKLRRIQESCIAPDSHAESQGIDRALLNPTSPLRSKGGVVDMYTCTAPPSPDNHP